MSVSVENLRNSHAVAWLSHEVNIETFLESANVKTSEAPVDVGTGMKPTSTLSAYEAIAQGPASCIAVVPADIASSVDASWGARPSL